MNAVHRVLSAIFDVLLMPFERMGDLVALILTSGIFGILALLIFKQISWQAGIKAAKDKIKGHMIAIRLYQDDLAIVFKAVMMVLLRNFQYLGLNFGPILPLFLPFVLIASQLVVRYGFDPLEVHDPATVQGLLPGRGSMLELHMKSEQTASVDGLTVELPPHLVALSPLARNARDGIAVFEFAAVSAGTGDIRFLVNGKLVGTKSVTAGKVPERKMQPERVSSFLSSWLWPAEPTFTADSPIDSVSFEYPARDFGVLPGGPGGVLLIFFLASILFGVAVLKPLNIQI
jgi:hypothetical protein